MNREQLRKKSESVMENLCETKGYVAPVDVFYALKVLSESDVEQWRKGSVPYLEKVIHLNLSQISFVMKELRSFAVKKQLKPSLTVYYRRKTKQLLRFSKSSQRNIQQHYATHYVDIKRSHELKERRKQSDKSAS